jgi:hypothetical protein
MQIDKSDEHCEKAESPKEKRLEPDSNVMKERD